jgi:hypothetical protein
MGVLLFTQGPEPSAFSYGQWHPTSRPMRMGEATSQAGWEDFPSGPDPPESRRINQELPPLSTPLVVRFGVA